MERRLAPAIPGRGAQGAEVPTRFGLATRELDGDWRDYMEQLDGPPVKLRTQVTEERPKTILSFNQSPDIAFDRSINAYRGCEHGCVYCFARPTHAYHDPSKLPPLTLYWVLNSLLLFTPGKVINTFSTPAFGPITFLALLMSILVIP